MRGHFKSFLIIISSLTFMCNSWEQCTLFRNVSFEGTSCFTIIFYAKSNNNNNHNNNGQISRNMIL